jgi:hypothetical protein
MHVIGEETSKRLDVIPAISLFGAAYLTAQRGRAKLVPAPRCPPDNRVHCFADNV